MKIKSFIYVFVLIALCTMVKRNASAQDDCYEIMTPPSYNCGSWSSVQYEDIQLDYFQCTVQVGYSTRECTFIDTDCNDMERTVLQIRLYSIDWDWDGCMALTLYLFPGYPNDFGNVNENNFAVIKAELQTKIAKLEFVDFYNGLSAFEQSLLNCTGTYPNCDPPDTYCRPFEVFWLETECSYLCIHEYEDGHNWIYPKPCIGSTTCCEYRNYFCMCIDPNDPNNYIINSYQESTSSTGTCTEAIVPTNPCGDSGTGGGATIHNTDCMSVCPE